MEHQELIQKMKQSIPEQDMDYIPVNGPNPNYIAFTDFDNVDTQLIPIADIVSVRAGLEDAITFEISGGLGENWLCTPMGSIYFLTLEFPKP